MPYMADARNTYIILYWGVFNKLSADVTKANVQDKIYVGKIVLIYSYNFWNGLSWFLTFNSWKKNLDSNANPLTYLVM